MNTIAPRLVLDTNILITIIGTRSPFRWVFDYLIRGQFILCVSNDILLEYQEVLTRKTNYKVAENVVNFLLVSPFTQKTETYFNFNLIAADDSDNKFVDCALAANADFIVSNDRHFQILKTVGFPSVPVMTLPEFQERFNPPPAHDEEV